MTHSKRISPTPNDYQSNASKPSLRDARRGLSRNPARSESRECLLYSSRSGYLSASDRRSTSRRQCPRARLVLDDQPRSLGSRPTPPRFLGGAIPSSSREVCAVPQRPASSNRAPMAESLLLLPGSGRSRRICAAIRRMEPQTSRDSESARFATPHKPLLQSR